MAEWINNMMTIQEFDVEPCTVEHELLPPLKVSVPGKNTERSWISWCVCCSAAVLLRLRTCSGPPQVRRLGASRLWPSWWRPAVRWRGRARRARATTWSGTGGPRAWWSILSVDTNTHNANNYVSVTSCVTVSWTLRDRQTLFFWVDSWVRHEDKLGII